MAGYPLERDVVFVLGAGASAPDGAPLQRDLLSYIVSSEDAELRETYVGSGVRAFLEAFYGPETEAGFPPSLEEVFGLLDYHISQRESLGDTWALESLPSLRSGLVACIHHAVHVGRNPPLSCYRAFWEKVRHHNMNISVVSLNYDSLLEEAFDPLYPTDALIDYCIPFLNYDNPKRMPAFFWWIDPRNYEGSEGTAPTPIKILKLHGSLNWKYCSICRGVLLTPWTTDIDLDQVTFRWNTGSSCAGPDEGQELVCPYDLTPFETLILPPSHVKQWSHPALSPILSEAIRELRAARRIVFVGYSFPEADVHLRSLFTRSVRSDLVSVVDPGLTPASEARYRSVFGKVDFVKRGFADFVQDGLAAVLK